MQKESFFEAPLALGLASGDDDILTAKRLFNEIGRLTEPPRGFSPRFDRDLDDAVTGLQRDNGLKLDGRINPGGPTERNIRRERGELPKEPPLDLAELDINAPIGNGLTNNPEDIIGVSKALGRLGLFTFDKTKEPSPNISRRLVAGLQKLQRQHGIPATGDFKPGDKTDAVLKAEVAKFLGIKPNANRTGALRTPPELLQDAQLESASDASPSAEPKADDTPTKLRDTKWVPTGIFLTKRTREFKTKGPIRVDASTASFLVDKRLYTVEWQPLDKFGRVMPEIRNRDKKIEERMAVAGNVGMIEGSRHIWTPPFDWPYGFRVKISIPPQASTRQGSLGIQLQILTSEGGLIK